MPERFVSCSDTFPGAKPHGQHAPAIATPKSIGAHGPISSTAPLVLQTRGSYSRAWSVGADPDSDLPDLGDTFALVTDQRYASEAEAQQAWDDGMDNEFTPFAGKVYQRGSSTIAVERESQFGGGFASSSLIVLVRTGDKITSLLYLTNTRKLGIKTSRAINKTLEQNLAEATLNISLPQATQDLNEHTCFFGSDVRLDTHFVNGNYRPNDTYADLTRARQNKMVAGFENQWPEYSAAFARDPQRPSKQFLIVTSRASGVRACLKAKLTSDGAFTGTRCP